MKQVYFLLLIVFSANFSLAQTGVFTITGKVVQQESKASMQGASVFAQNTTFGTVTDAEGNFKLQLPYGGYDLIITYTGYETGSLHISTSSAEDKNIVIDLKQKDKTLEAVAVVGTTEVKDGWEKYGSFFVDNFIGKTEFSKECVIKNPEILKFYFSKRKNKLKILAAEPLLIENNALGYKIKLALDSFTYEYGTEINTYTGYPLFEEMQPQNDEQQKKWTTNRQVAYRGSMLHFMRSVYNKRLKEEGFEIQFLVKTDIERAVKLKDFYGALNYTKDDSTQTVDILPNQLKLAVLYTKEKPSPNYLAQAGANEPKDFQFSFLDFLPENSIEIEQNGYFFEQNDLAISGYWTWEKVADMLPYDYKGPVQ